MEQKSVNKKMNLYIMYLTPDQGEILNEIKKINTEVIDEIHSEKPDNKKLYNLRFQQLMRGIYLTQNTFQELM